MSRKPDIEELAFKRNDLNAQMSALITERKKADDRIKEIAQHISNIDKLIAGIRRDLKSCKVGITDHALLRYLERIHGFDVEEVKKRLLTDKLRTSMQMYGKGKITENGITYIFRDNAVVTIMTD
jgi:chromosome segregation ATPase